jgi:hypothetical protein
VNGDAQDALAELQAIFAEAGTDRGFLEDLRKHLEPFLNKVPDDLRDDVPLLELSRQKRFADIVQQVAPGLLAQLNAQVS